MSRENHLDVVRRIHDALNPPHTAAGTFDLAKRVAWELRDEGCGLIEKNYGGENEVPWHGTKFAAGRVCYPDGQIYKIASDVGDGGANEPAWNDDGLCPSNQRYVPAIDPESGEPGDEPPSEKPVDLSGVLAALADLGGKVDRLGAAVDAVKRDAAAAAFESLNAATRCLEILNKPGPSGGVCPPYDVSIGIPFIGTARGTATPRK